MSEKEPEEVTAARDWLANTDPTDRHLAADYLAEYVIKQHQTMTEYKAAVSAQLHYDMRCILSDTPENRSLAELRAERDEARRRVYELEAVIHTEDTEARRDRRLLKVEVEHLRDCLRVSEEQNDALGDANVLDVEFSRIRELAAQRLSQANYFLAQRVAAEAEVERLAAACESMVVECGQVQIKLAEIEAERDALREVFEAAKVVVDDARADRCVRLGSLKHAVNAAAEKP